MPVSYNGWSAPPPNGIRPLVVDGASFAPGVRDDDDVWTVLEYAARQWDERVEWLRPGWCWGYSYRATTGGSSLSNHASATAFDANAPLHPYGVPASRNFTPAQLATLNHIVNVECEGILRGGWTYSTPDAMHVELDNGVTPSDVKRVANKIRSGSMDAGDVRKIVTEALAPLKAAERHRAEAQKRRDREQAQRDKVHGRLLEAIADELGVGKADKVRDLGRKLAEDGDRREAELEAQDAEPVHGDE